MPQAEPSRAPRRDRCPRPAGPWPRAPCPSAARRVAAPARLAPGSRETERARSSGRRAGSARAAALESGEGAAGEREGAHSPPHTALRESQSSRSACTQSRRFMLLLWPPPPPRGPGQGAGVWAERPEAEGGASRGSCVRARSSRGSRAARRYAPSRAAGWPAAASSLPQPPLSRRGAAPPSWPRRLRGRRRARSKWLAARLRLQRPVAQAASGNAPRSLQGLHFVACGLAASPLGHVVIGRAGGGAGKREREQASRTAPLPARTGQPQPGREREPRGGPTTKAARPL